MTELIWEGKYVDGKKTGPVRVALPFQDIETVNESARSRARQLDLWSRGEETHRLAQIMGHDSLDTTLIYVRGTKNDLQKEVEKMRGHHKLAVPFVRVRSNTGPMATGAIPTPTNSLPAS